MVSAFVDMEDAVPHFSSSAASQKARFSPVMHTHTDEGVVEILRDSTIGLN